ncbi:hypothetical protein B0H14DRAFT_3041122, partial [Mycena olivaceomarginata]
MRRKAYLLLGVPLPVARVEAREMLDLGHESAACPPRGLSARFPYPRPPPRTSSTPASPSTSSLYPSPRFRRATYTGETRKRDVRGSCLVMMMRVLSRRRG